MKRQDVDARAVEPFARRRPVIVLGVVRGASPTETIFMTTTSTTTSVAVGEEHLQRLEHVTPRALTERKVESTSKD